MKKTKIEMVYEIYHGERMGEYYGPSGEKQAEMIITENASDDEIIKNLIASDFLSQWADYMVIDNGPSIHIHYNVEGMKGKIVLVLMYLEDVIPMNWNKVSIFKEIDATYSYPEEKLKALTDQGFELEDIFDIAMTINE